MSLVIDSNVFVAAARAPEPHHTPSLDFLDTVSATSRHVCCPVLVLPESSAAIVRRTDDERLARGLVTRIEQFPNLELVSLTTARALQAADLAARLKLRGADAIYTAVAQEYGGTLVTWDQEMLQRAAAVVPVQTPAQWLQAHAGPLGAGPT